MNILDTLNEEEKKLLKYRKLLKNEVLFREDELCQYVTFIIKGSFSIVSFLSDGKEVIYNQPQENDMFGNNLIFSSEPYYKGDIVADSDCLIAMIGKDDLLDILKNNQNFMVEYMRVQSNFAKNLNNTIRLLAIDSAEERLFFYLHSHHNSIEYDSITSLARKLFMQRETLSRLLSRLEKDGAIKRIDSKIILR